MASAARILLVGARTATQRGLGSVLRSRGFQVDDASSGHQALVLANERSPDLVLLHLALPDADSLDVCADIRGQSDVLIIALSTRNEEAQRVAALDAGADDCVNEHFGLEELLARIRAHLRRAPRWSSTRRKPTAASVVRHDLLTGVTSRDRPEE